MLIAGVVGGGYVLFFSEGVSKEEFTEQADDICRATYEESATLDPGDPTSLGSTADYYEANRELLVAQTRDIRALESPEEDAELLQDWLNTQDQLALAFETAIEAAADDDREGFDAALADMALVQGRSTELATRYGFDVCGIGSPE